jgi:hypothetical protein
LQSFGWIDEGRFVKNVLEVVVTMGLATKKEIEQLLEKEVYSKNMLKFISRCFCALLFSTEIINYLSGLD